MMQIFKTRKLRKEMKETLHHAKHVRHMHEDIANPELLNLLHEAEQLGQAARKSGSVKDMNRAGDAIAAACEKIVPERSHKKLRENVEVIFVSIAAAMAIRAYFFQPFKIPTGSMQPTLYGITMQETPTLAMTNPLFKAANLILFGEKTGKTILAKNSGRIQTGVDRKGNRRPYFQPNPDHSLTIFIGNTPHKIPAKLAYDNLLRIGEDIRAGEPIARSAIRKSGDYILVNRLKYNFIRPKRGDITVFDTVDIEHPQVREAAYYIKRMVGLPSESISVADGELRVDGQKPTNSRFDKIFSNDDYSGYQYGSRTSVPRPLIGEPGDAIHLKDDEVLFFGDNTASSLDGRYFGAVKRKRILGPAFFVCWPLDRAGFAEIHH